MLTASSLFFLPRRDTMTQAPPPDGHVAKWILLLTLLLVLAARIAAG